MKNRKPENHKASKVEYIGSIVIVSYNSAAETERCLKSLLKLSSIDQIKIIVVDNCSNDNTCELISNQFPSVFLIKSQFNGGFGAGNNLGIAASEGNWIYFLNPDSVVQSGCLSILNSYLSNNPKVGCVAPAILDEKGNSHQSYFHFTTLWMSILSATGLINVFQFNRISGKLVLNYKPVNDTVEVDRVLGAAMMIRREAIVEIGGFDEEFFLYSEEEDVCFRLFKSGFRIVYQPEAKVSHVGGCSTDSIKPVAIAAANWSRYVFMRKHMGWISAELSRWIWVKMLLLRLLIVHLQRNSNQVSQQINGYVYSIRSLIQRGYFDRTLRPQRRQI